MATPTYRTFKRQVKPNAGQHLAFAAGRGYYTAPGAPHPPVAAAPPPAARDPYDPIIGGLPKPLTNAQITQQAQGQISPLVAAVTGQIGKQTQAATHAIAGYSGDAAAKLAGMDWQQPYSQAQQGQAAVDAALRQSLAGAGQSGADELAQRLAVINDPAVAAASGALAANGADNGSAVLAGGSASLGNLLANAAAAGSFGEKQPGITRLAGLQGIAAAGQQGQHEIATQSQALEAQLPSIIAGLQGRNDSRSTALASARQNKLARNDAIDSSAASNETKVAVANANNATREQIAKIQADGRASAAQAAQARSDRTYRLQFAKTFGFDPITNATLPGYKRDANGAVVKVGSGTGPNGTKPPTASQISNYVDAWKNGKPSSRTVQAPQPDANGNPVYRTVKEKGGQLSFTQAYKRLTAMGVGDQQARKYLASAYKRGEQGRGWLTNEEQATLARLKVQPRAHRYKGVAYLDRTQAEALTSAKRMPPGHWIQGSTSTQDLGPIYVIDESYD